MKRKKLMKTSIEAPKPPSRPVIEHYRDLTNLGSLIASSPETFWCYIHLADLPLSEQSLDPRYCKSCHAVLTRDREDSRASGNFRKPWWVPQNGKRRGKDSVVVEIQEPQKMSAQKGLIPVSASITLTMDEAKRNKQLVFDGMGIKEAVMT
jgi:hypothetical protein